MVHSRHATTARRSGRDRAAPRAAPAWLGEGDGDPAALLHPPPDHPLRTSPVSRAVNAPRNDSPDLLEASLGDAI